MIPLRAMGVAAVGVTIVLGLAVTAASPASIEHNRSGLDRADVIGYLAESPGAPLVLPRDLRPDLVWLGPTFADHGADGLVTTRSSTFTLEQVASGPTIFLCLEGPSLGAGCPGGDRVVRRRLDAGDEVVIAFRGPKVGVAELDWWRTVTLESVTLPSWLR